MPSCAIMVSELKIAVLQCPEPYCHLQHLGQLQLPGLSSALRTALWQLL